MPVPGKSIEDEDIFALEQALNWRATQPLPWHSIAGSLTFHLIGLILCLSISPAAFVEVRVPTLPADVVHVFVPPTHRVSTPPAPEHALLRAAARPDPAQIELPDDTESKVTVNLNSIELFIALDLRNQLPAVVETQHGMLALLDKEDLGIARYLMEPPGWVPRPTITDVSRGLRFRMDPPGKWPIFREAAGRYGIDVDRYIGCAVFDATFRNCLKAAIQSRLSPHDTGSVSSAHLAFAADHACGIEVLQVTVARRPARKP